jgi:hypothetical protein
MRTHVCITIDTEFSIAGAFADSTLRPVALPFVDCDVNGHSEGLGFLLACFAHYRIDATFFIETVQRHFFTADPMAAVAQRIHAAGHEVQLHAHPCWAVFQHADWDQRVRLQPRQDDFHGRGEANSVALIEHGLQTFATWRLPRPRVFRSGSLQHDDLLYRALARCAVPYSSNVGLAVFNSGDPRYQLHGGRHLRHGVLENPVLTFCDWAVAGRRHQKTLTIAGTSFAETRALLEQAHQQGIGQVVILTHPFEYIHSRTRDLADARRHGTNQRRLRRLCRYLDGHRDRYTPSGLAAAASRPVLAADSAEPQLAGRLPRALLRMAGQLAADGGGRLALALAKARTASSRRRAAA